VIGVDDEDRFVGSLRQRRLARCVVRVEAHPRTEEQVAVGADQTEALAGEVLEDNGAIGDRPG
jgi:hypothetical protein